MSSSTTSAIEPQFRTIDSIPIRFADSGGSRKPTLLLTSPWPESLYAFASMWETLCAHARVFAVDLPGFGASERRDDLFAPRTMGPVLVLRSRRETAAEQAFVAALPPGHVHVPACARGRPAARRPGARSDRRDRVRVLVLAGKSTERPRCRL